MTFFGALFSQFSNVLNTFITFVILREVALFVCLFFFVTHAHDFIRHGESPSCHKHPLLLLQSSPQLLLRNPPHLCLLL